ncbi:ABC transporter substrate-binding protein [Anabaena sp. UHCC 0204]|uniref:ABC transporter substrate-binding protein n=1 Tax=Anabaena sp. UHCC 0204 TaxID=2590009 RepID=UPI00144757AD|nr:ABC transporter substrate-binding protein [Anabaena sp. UHCC 0204]MTJ09416.1 ABC transporter substrate-binding protein [Anabaena sp. UHCC 0204]
MFLIPRNYWRLAKKYLKPLLLVLFLGIVSLHGCQAIRSHQVIHITLWHGVNPPQNRDVLQKLVDKFNQNHPNIQVESLYVGQQDQQMPKILTAVVGDAPPDLLWFNPTIAGQLVELGALLPLDEKLAKTTVKDEIDPALLTSMKYKNQIWSVPFATNNVGVYYRPSLFKEAGITELPQTWEELRQAAKQLTRDTNNDGRINQYGIMLPAGKGEFTVFTWLPFMWSASGKLVGDNSQSAADVVLENNQGAIAALELWQNLIKDGSAVLSGIERGYEIENIVNGRVAMQVTGPWSLGEFKQSGVDFAVFPIPMNKKPATVIGGENLFLFKTTPKREQAAFKFIEYTLSADFQTELALGTGYLPINIKSRQSPIYQEFLKKQPQIQVFLDQAKNGFSRPIFPGYTRISDSLGRAIESVILGKSSPAEALKVAQQRLDLIFK